jgi:hypothetical protein
MPGCRWIAVDDPAGQPAGSDLDARGSGQSTGTDLDELARAATDVDDQDVRSNRPARRQADEGQKRFLLVLEDRERLARQGGYLGDDLGGVRETPERLRSHDQGVRRPDLARTLDVGGDRCREGRSTGRAQGTRTIDRRAEPEERRLVVEDHETRAFWPGDQEMD